MDASGRSGNADSDSDGRRGEWVVVGQWPDGTAITEADCRAPEDARELRPDQRRLARELRRTRRRARSASISHTLGSPRAAIAIVMLAAIIASAIALLLPMAR